MKLYITIFILLISSLANAQDARPLKKGKINNFTNHKEYDVAHHGGAFIKIGKFDDNVYIVLRERVYGEDAIQSTLIFRHRMTEIKAYSYLNFPDFSMTYALALRIYLSNKQKL
jgi:hypothetical protein